MDTIMDLFPCRWHIRRDFHGIGRFVKKGEGEVPFFCL